MVFILSGRSFRSYPNFSDVVLSRRRHPFHIYHHLSKFRYILKEKIDHLRISLLQVRMLRIASCLKWTFPNRLCLNKQCFFVHFKCFSVTMVPTFPPKFSMIQQETNSYNYNPSLWYPAGYPQPGPVNPQPGYGITEQEEQIMYQQYNQQVAQGPYYPSHNYSHIDNPQYFNYDYVYPGNNGIPSMQYQHPGGPTPPVTVNGSECSPDGLNININPSQFEPQLMNNPEPVAQQSYEWTQNKNCNTEPKPGE